MLQHGPVQSLRERILTTPLRTIFSCQDNGGALVLILLEEAVVWVWDLLLYGNFAPPYKLIYKTFPARFRQDRGIPTN